MKVIFASLSGDLMLDILIGARRSRCCRGRASRSCCSSATFAAAGVITVPEGMALVLGANLGSGLLALS